MRTSILSTLLLILGGSQLAPAFAAETRKGPECSTAPRIHASDCKIETPKSNR